MRIATTAILRQAVVQEDVITLDALCKVPSIVQRFNRESDWPLLAVAAGNSLTSLQVILKYVSDVGGRSRMSRFSMLHAVSTAIHLSHENLRQMIDLILERDLSLLDALSETGLSPLHMACMHENYAVAHHLIERGCRVDHCMGLGETPLAFVCKSLVNSKCAQTAAKITPPQNANSEKVVKLTEPALALCVALVKKGGANTDFDAYTHGTHKTPLQWLEAHLDSLNDETHQVKQDDSSQLSFVVQWMQYHAYERRKCHFEHFLETAESFCGNRWPLELTSQVLGYCETSMGKQLRKLAYACDFALEFCSE